MARNYNHVIRFLESWFADINSPDKEFSDADKWLIVMAIFECQVKTSLEPLHALPLAIRRGLSMATLGEQITAVLERAESYRARGFYARKQQLAAADPRAKIARELEMKDQEKREEQRQASEEELKAELKLWKARTPLELYQKQIAAAVGGDEAMRKKFPNWAELAKKALKDA